MISHLIAPILIFLSVGVTTLDVNSVPSQLLASKEISLETRYDDAFVNGVFKDNILLNIAYLSGKVTNAADINWEEVGKPFKYKFSLDPGKTFAFHEDVLPQYAVSLTLTTNAHFNFDDGFKSDGWLFGDGVCHLASLMYWAAKEAGLDAYAPARHDFRAIPEIPREFGVSIYKMPGQVGANAYQNLYITNNQAEPIVFEFDYNGKTLKFSVSK